VAIDFGLPERPRGEPVVVVAVDDQGGGRGDAGRGHQFFELLFGQDVATHGVAKLRVPGPGDGAGDVAFIVGFRVHIDFDDADVGVGGMGGCPIGAD